MAFCIQGRHRLTQSCSFEAQSPGPHTSSAYASPPESPPSAQGWTSQGRILPGVGLARLHRAHPLPHAGLPAHTWRTSSLPPSTRQDRQAHEPRVSRLPTARGRRARNQRCDAAASLACSPLSLLPTTQDPRGRSCATHAPDDACTNETERGDYSPCAWRSCSDGSSNAASSSSFSGSRASLRAAMRSIAGRASIETTMPMRRPPMTTVASGR
jgi:hypothetical protein